MAVLGKWNVPAAFIVALLVVFVVVAWRRRCWPSAGQCMLLIAYGFGVWNSLLMGYEVLTLEPKNTDRSAGHLMAFAILLLFSVRGISEVFKEVITVTPKLGQPTDSDSA